MGRSRGAERSCSHSSQRNSLGLLPQDGKLPSERTLASKYGVSRTTAREALLRLRARGLVEAHPGRRAQAVVMEEAVRLENLGVALLGEGPSHPERQQLLAGYLELKREVTYRWTQCALDALWSRDVKALRSRLPALLQASDERVLQALAPTCEAHGVASLLGAQEQASEVEVEAHPTPAQVHEASEPAAVLLTAPQVAEVNELAETLLIAPQAPVVSELAAAPLTSLQVPEVGPSAPEPMQARGPGALCANWSGCHTSLCEEPPGGAPLTPVPAAPHSTPNTGVLWPRSMEEDAWPWPAGGHAPGLT